MDKNSKGNPFLIVFLAVVLLVMLSLLPWSRITDNHVKDFDLISDISLSAEPMSFVTNELLDPELEAEIQALEAVAEIQEPADTGHVRQEPEIFEVEEFDPRVDGNMVIEDYTDGGTGMYHTKAALAERYERPVRIAFIGDSYIEGDIFTQDIREQLQDMYGGNGVGYMCMQSEISGFRRSVRHTATGWTAHDIRKSGNSRYNNLSGEYFVGETGATVLYKGTDRLGHLSSWNSSKFIFIAPSPGNITISTDSGSKDYEIEAGEHVQCISIDEPTARLSIVNNVPDIVALGVWLTDNSGIEVDCMSLRGDSGISHRKLDISLSQEMSKYIDYDLIVLEYGINALSSQQYEYSSYGRLMEGVIGRIRACYPNADILVLGIGDRGQKQGTEVHSLTTAPNMVAAQRQVARRTGCMFWDTRQAMGGKDAIVEWRNKGLANADYIHLNHNGGKVLATEFVKSLTRALGE